MEPRWSQPIPQVMQQHGAPPKNAPRPDKAKRIPRELEVAEAGESTPERLRDRAA